ncbi:MAG: hypothetical protein HYU66_25605 [Armatimonadetes bacterium]|nr:hypothetical protein [Armatimonadota bacterium]
MKAWRRFLFLVSGVASTTALLYGCGSSTPAAGGGPGGPGGSRGAYVGAQVCTGCHSQIAEHWEGTAHAEAVATLAAIGQAQNPACLACHTTGAGQAGGFVDAATTPGLLNVQCESCHGPGGEHVAAPSRQVEGGNILRLVPSSTCGGCHNGRHHQQYEEWQQSKKSDSLPDNHAGTCVQCHTAEGFVWKLNAPLQPEAEEARQLGEPATTNLECWSCHNPHQAVAGTTRQLRMPVNQLCAQCHRSRDERTTPGTRVHNPQAEVLNGTVGYTWDGTKFLPLPLPSVPVTHAQATAGDCSICHVYQYETTNDVGQAVNNTGHHFWPALRACSRDGCHSNLTPRQVVPGLAGAIEEGATQGVLDLFNTTQAAFDTRLNALRARLNAIVVNNLTVPQKGAYDVAKWNLDVCNADKSHGIHNLQYLTLMMDEAERILDDVLD